MMQPHEHQILPIPLPQTWQRHTRASAGHRTTWGTGLLWAGTMLAAVLAPVLGDPVVNGLNALVLLTFVTVGALIALHRPDNPIGWLVVVGTLFWALGACGVAYAVHAVGQPPSAVPGAAAVAVLGTWARALGWTLMVTFLLLLFPTGQLPSARWRPAAVIAALYLGLWTIAALLAPTPVDDRLAALRNPIGIPAASGLPTVASALSLPVLLVCGAALVARFRRARGAERQQLKWLTYGAALPLFLIGLALATGNGSLPWAQIVVILPVAVGIAILRYHVYDIDLLINRTLVYGALTAGVVGLYVLVVGGLGTVVAGHGRTLIAVLATGLVAVLVQPARAALQRSVNRLMYGQRDDPYAVLAALGRRLDDTVSPEAVLPNVVETIRDALKLPYVALTLQHDGAFTIAAVSGAPGEGVLTFPLVYQHETVGQLLLAPRRGEETVTPADARLVADLARQAGVAAHAVQLTAALQRARERLVTAREEERRRLRRDLHDGLGPLLGSQTLTLSAVRKLLRYDPQTAERLLDDAMAHAEDAINDIRRLVYDLRPPALDDLGLLGALREGAARYSRTGLHVAVETPPSLPPLPAAVEVACYRIAHEALTNVVRHAQARTCVIRLQVDAALRLEILDDGVGFAPDDRMGIGLRSMRERAVELGGTCVVEPQPGGGTVVGVALPLRQGS